MKVSEDLFFHSRLTYIVQGAIVRSLLGVRVITRAAVVADALQASRLRMKTRR